MEAEILVVLWGLRYFRFKNAGNVIFETDSLSLQKIIDDVLPWQIREQVEEMRLHMANIQKHNYREANHLADRLANHAFDKGGDYNS